MKRTLFGVDLKILPEGLREGQAPWQKAKVIEANGWNTGLTVLDGAGHGRFIEALSPDRAKLFLYRFQKPGDEPENWARDFIIRADALLGVRYPFAQVEEWIEDVSAVFTGRRAKQLAGRELEINRNADAIIAASRRYGNEALLVPSLAFTRHGVRLGPKQTTTSFGNAGNATASKFDPETRILAWDSLAFVMGVHPSKLERLTADETLYFNSSMAETLVGNKGLLYEVDNLFPDLEIKLQKYQPSTTVWGCGLNTIHAFQAWLHAEPGTLFVRKPLAGVQGKGVRFVGRRELLDGLEAHVLPEHALAGYRNLIVDLFMGDADVESRAAVIQAFIPSVPLRWEGRPHDASARAIVVSGSFIGGGLRLGAASLDSDAGPASKFLGSLSRGSRLTPLEPEHLDIASEVSQAFVKDLTAACAILTDKLGDDRFACLDGPEGLAGRLKAVYILKRLKLTARRHFDLANALEDTLPRDLARSLREVLDVL